MDLANREYLVARIVSGVLRCTLPDPVTGKPRTFLLTQPSRLQRYVAQQVYQDAARAGELDGLFTEDEVVSALVDEGLWSWEQEEALSKLPTYIEDLKVNLYRAEFKSDQRRAIRNELGAAKKKLEDLTHKKTAYHHATIGGAAQVARFRFLIGASLCYADGRPVYDTEEAFWQEQHPILDAAVETASQSRIDEAEYRDLARNDPWRSVWVGRKSEGSVFGVPAADLTEEQKTLLSWTQIYDNVHEHPQAPSSVVINDDDMLDGWMTVQRRERESAVEKAQMEGVIGNEKIANSEQVFIVCNTATDAAKVDSLNSEAARRIKQRQFRTIHQKGGAVQDWEMPDQQAKIRAQYTQMMRERKKG